MKTLIALAVLALATVATAEDKMIKSVLEAIRDVMSELGVTDFSPQEN